MRKSFLVIAFIYGMILSSLFYWQLCADLNVHPANPRYYLMFQAERGTIYDRNGEPLAKSMQEDAGYTRNYAAVSLSHVVGYFHQRYGMTGLERLYHEELLSGRSLFTTLDLSLQRLAETLLEGHKGAIVALNPNTGEILALASSPAVDGNALDENWPNYLADLRSPFLNRVTHGLYPPGSLIKPIVYAAALNEGLVTADQVWDDQGVLHLQNRTLSNYGQKRYGQINLDQALAYSSNVVFAQLAIPLGDRLVDYFQRFSLGSEVSFELRNLAGHVPSKIVSPYGAAQAAIGQGELLVTPLQMALLASTIANGGVMMQPFVVQEVRGGLKMRQITRPQVLADVISRDIAVQLRDAMVLCAQEGTGKTRFTDTLDYAAKTGTAQTNQGADHAWFIGFAPTNQPEVAVAVLVEHGGAGGTAAAPLGAEVMLWALGQEDR